VIRVVLDANVLGPAALTRDAQAPSVRMCYALLEDRIEFLACPSLLG
jgi:hypothetical protein